VGPAPGGRDRGRVGFYRGLTEALLEVARAHFALSKPGENGKSRLQVLTEIRKQTGVVAKELRDLPSIPDETAHIWRWFNQLSRRRGAGYSIEALAWKDIDAYFTRMRVNPYPWELDAIVDLDDAFLTSRFAKTAGVIKGAADLQERVRRKKE
jgi:hypothetical protein